MRRNAVFIEDYDLVVARYLVQGVDVWLNNPRRFLEASGTSGMKVVCNGGLNLSILDGWWVEGYHPDAGWAIGRGEDYQDLAYQDYVESNLLYELLEKDVVPLFYDRSADGLPRHWIAKMKKSMRLLGPTFSATRMLWEYSERYYLPAAKYYAQITEGQLERARQLVQWKNALRQHWGEVRVEKVEARRDGQAQVGEEFEVAAEIRLGPISPNDVRVELYYGRLSADRHLLQADGLPMEVQQDLGHGRHLYVGRIPCEHSGMHGYTVRVTPHHPDLNHFAATGLIAWR
jgi:starch phosphorylase